MLMNLMLMIFTNFGTVATILQLLRLPDGTVKVLVEGIERAKISHFVENQDFFEAYLDKLSLTKLRE